MSRTLPPWNTFVQALSLVRERLPFMLKIGWPFLLLAVLVGAGIDAGIFTAPPATTLSGTPVSTGQIAVGGDFADLLVTALQLLLWAVLAVFWHRNILLGERMAPALPFRFDRPFVRYIIQGLKLTLVTILFVLLLMAGMLAFFFSFEGFTKSIESGDSLQYLPLLALWILAMMFVMFRLSLCLPAAAIGEDGFGLRDSWRATKGHSLSILLLQVIMLALGAAWSMVTWGIGLVLGGTAAAVPNAIGFGLTGLFSLFYVALGLSLLTIAWDRLGRTAPAKDAAMAAA